MKKFAILLIITTAFIQCQKNEECNATKGTVLLVEPTCRFTFKKELFIADGSRDTLIIDSLPPQLKINKLRICADTKESLDLALCACCGNKWVKLSNAQKLE